MDVLGTISAGQTARGGRLPLAELSASWLQESLMPEDWRVANEASHFRNDERRLQGRVVVTYIKQKDKTERPGEVRTAEGGGWGRGGGEGRV